MHSKTGDIIIDQEAFNMVVGIIGESCTGKSTIAKLLAEALGAKVYSGKDYLRLAKGEAEAKRIFREMMCESGTPIIYIISEMEHLSLLAENAFRVLVTADVDSIKQRFAKRLNGPLPAPISAMIEKKHGMFDGQRYDVCLNTDLLEPAEAARIIAGRLNI